MGFYAGLRVIWLYFFFGVWVSIAAAQDRSFEKLMVLAQENNAEAQYHVGMIFNNGIGVPKDPKRAFAWFEKGASQGDALASYKVGCYFAGQFEGVVTVNKALAFDYKLRAAQAGYALAQADLAQSYLMREDYENGFRWTSAAAAQGDETALYNLAVMFKEGHGVTVDKVLSYSYLQLGTLASGRDIHPGARAALDDLRLTMSAEELERAEKFVVQWRPRPTPLTLRAKAGFTRVQWLLEEVADATGLLPKP